MSDLDDEELKATKKLYTIIKENNMISLKELSKLIEEDLEKEK